MSRLSYDTGNGALELTGNGIKTSTSSLPSSADNQNSATLRPSHTSQLPTQQQQQRRRINVAQTADIESENEVGYRYDIRPPTKTTLSFVPALQFLSRAEMTSMRRSVSIGGTDSSVVSLSCDGRSFFAAAPPPSPSSPKPLRKVGILSASCSGLDVANRAPTHRHYVPLHRRRPMTSSANSSSGCDVTVGHNMKSIEDIEAAARRHIWSCHVPGSVKRSSRVVNSIGELYGALMTSSKPLSASPSTTGNVGGVVVSGSTSGYRRYNRASTSDVFQTAFSPATSPRPAAHNGSNVRLTASASIASLPSAVRGRAISSDHPRGSGGTPVPAPRVAWLDRQTPTRRSEDHALLANGGGPGVLTVTPLSPTRSGRQLAVKFAAQ